MNAPKGNVSSIGRDASGVAALSICKAILSLLAKRQILSRDEILGLVSDARETHHNSMEIGEDTALHFAVVAILDRLLCDFEGVAA